MFSVALASSQQRMRDRKWMPACQCSITSGFQGNEMFEAFAQAQEEDNLVQGSLSGGLGMRSWQRGAS